MRARSNQHRWDTYAEQGTPDADLGKRSISALYEWWACTYIGEVQLSLFSLFRRKASAAPQQPQPDTGLSAGWARLIDQYFPQRQDLKDYEVSWSRRRQRRTLGSCNISGRKVRIAKELNHPEFACWVEPVLYHELCHAVLGTAVRSHCGKRAWHGAEFKSLEARHPQSAALAYWMRNGGWQRAVRSRAARTAGRGRRILKS